MTNDAGRRLAEALQARASTSLPGLPQREQLRAVRQPDRTAIPLWLLLLGALVLGALAGALAALTSAL